MEVILCWQHGTIEKGVVLLRKEVVVRVEIFDPALHPELIVEVDEFCDAAGMLFDVGVKFRCFLAGHIKDDTVVEFAVFLLLEEFYGVLKALHMSVSFSSFAHKKCAKLQKFFETRKKKVQIARRKGVKVPLERKIIGIQSRINGRNRHPMPG